MLQRIDDLSSLEPGVTSRSSRGRSLAVPAGLDRSRSKPSGSESRAVKRTPDIPGINELLGILTNNKALIAATSLLCLLGAVLFSSWARPQYHATTQILIDPRDLQLLDKDVTPRAASTDSGISIVESQARVLASDSVMLRVVKSQKLQDDLEFNGLRQSFVNGFQVAISRKLGLGADTAADDPALQALRTLKRQVFIRRAERSFVVDVTVQSEDPNKSVGLANAIAEAYLKEQAMTRTDAVRSAGAAIGAGLGPMKERVSQAEAKIARYKADKNLVLAGGRFDNEQQLTEVNNQLTLARAESARLKARVDEILSARGNNDVIPEAVRSESLRALRAQLGTVLREKARLSAQLQPSHPRMIDIANQERQSQRLIDEETRRIVESTKLEYRRTQSSEQELQDRLVMLKSQMVTTNDALVELREMERDLEASRAVYAASLNRAREAKEQEQLNTTNARVITVATPPRDKSWPPRKSILLPAALLAGLGLGGLLALGASALASARRPALLQPEVTPEQWPEPADIAATRELRTDKSEPDLPQAPRETRVEHPTPDRWTARPPETPQGPAAPEVELLNLPMLFQTAPIKFVDHLTAVEQSSERYPAGYQHGIDSLLMVLASKAEPDRAWITIVAGASPGVGSSSTALSLAYRAAKTGTRTLLIDACSADADLSYQLASALVQSRPCVLDSREHLAEITMRDERTGLALLPLAFTNLATFSPQQRRRLLAGLRGLVADYELVLIDIGDPAANSSSMFLAGLANHVLIVTRQLQIANAIQIAGDVRAPSRGTSVVKIAARTRTTSVTAI
jgi:polysaccharide biosynthesis transport protein